MPKLSQKLRQKIADKLRPIVDETGKQLYNQLVVVTQNMNISFDDLLKSSSDYNSFWELVAKYYNDYVDINGYEEVI